MMTEKLTKKITKPLLREGEPQRIVIINVYPQIEGGRFPIKRCVNEEVRVEADIFADGHDEITACLLYRHESEKNWHTVPFIPLTNDRWFATFSVKKIGNYYYTLNAWMDESRVTQYKDNLKVTVDRPKANFSAWYELFPRSWSATPGKHGTFKDVIANLPYIKEMGFDVLYFPPIHPVGKTHRKGKNNVTSAQKSDPGSPWGIGSEEGGHTAIHPQLGTLEDLRALIKAAKNLNMEIALDFALQCSPDHPYLKEHREWFKSRPDGTLQYAENPPKKYEDVYPLYFGTKEWMALWKECKKILLYWIKEGIRIFRVDNPHTKPFSFWEWLIQEIKTKYPDVIFLSEAFTRPKIMYYLAKLGFTQSYTYFTWRNTKEEITEYFKELTSLPVRDFFRPSLWPNTPDILHEYLQVGGPPAFIIRFILAATLGTNYGIYGPAFELCIQKPIKQGSEEYFDSEKYEIKKWNLAQSGSLKSLIGKVNQIRHEHTALQNMQSLKFHPIDNPQIICYSKNNEDFSDIIFVVVNLDFKYAQSGWVEMLLEEWNIHSDTYQVRDLLTGVYYTWNKYRNYVELDPHRLPVHIFHIEKV